MTTKSVHEVLGLIQKNLECPICLELLNKPVSTRCGHQFCRFCIREFLQTKSSVSCPLCKKPVTKRSLQEREDLSHIVNNIRDLITAFQRDSGTIFSPPRGPQPARSLQRTPELIQPQQSVARKKNIRKKGTRRRLQSPNECTGSDTRNDNLDDPQPIVELPKTHNKDTTRTTEFCDQLSVEELPRSHDNVTSRTQVNDLQPVTELPRTRSGSRQQLQQFRTFRQGNNSVPINRENPHQIPETSVVATDLLDYLDNGWCGALITDGEMSIGEDDKKSEDDDTLEYKESESVNNEECFKQAVSPGSNDDTPMPLFQSEEITVHRKPSSSSSENSCHYDQSDDSWSGRPRNIKICDQMESHCFTRSHSKYPQTLENKHKSIDAKNQEETVPRTRESCHQMESLRFTRSHSTYPQTIEKQEKTEAERQEETVIDTENDSPDFNKARFIKPDVAEKTYAKKHARKTSHKNVMVKDWIDRLPHKIQVDHQEVDAVEIIPICGLSHDIENRVCNDMTNMYDRTLNHNDDVLHVNLEDRCKKDISENMYDRTLNHDDDGLHVNLEDRCKKDVSENMHDRTLNHNDDHVDVLRVNLEDGFKMDISENLHVKVGMKKRIFKSRQSLVQEPQNEKQVTLTELDSDPYEFKSSQTPQKPKAKTKPKRKRCKAKKVLKIPLCVSEKKPENNLRVSSNQTTDLREYCTVSRDVSVNALTSTEARKVSSVCDVSVNTSTSTEARVPASCSKDYPINKTIVNEDKSIKKAKREKVVKKVHWKDDDKELNHLIDKISQAEDHDILFSTQDAIDNMDPKTKDVVCVEEEVGYFDHEDDDYHDTCLIVRQDPDTVDKANKEENHPEIALLSNVVHKKEVHIVSNSKLSVSKNVKPERNVQAQQTSVSLVSKINVLNSYKEVNSETVVRKQKAVNLPSAILEVEDIPQILSPAITVVEHTALMNKPKVVVTVVAETPLIGTRLSLLRQSGSRITEDSDQVPPTPMVNCNLLKIRNPKKKNTSVCIPLSANKLSPADKGLNHDPTRQDKMVAHLSKKTERCHGGLQTEQEDNLDSSADSSGTEDMDTTPNEIQFEIPNLDIQPEEIKLLLTQLSEDPLNPEPLNEVLNVSEREELPPGKCLLSSCNVTSQINAEMRIVKYSDVNLSPSNMSAIPESFDPPDSMSSRSQIQDEILQPTSANKKTNDVGNLSTNDVGNQFTTDVNQLTRVNSCTQNSISDFSSVKDKRNGNFIQSSTDKRRVEMDSPVNLNKLSKTKKIKRNKLKLKGSSKHQSDIDVHILLDDPDDGSVQNLSNDGQLDSNGNIPPTATPPSKRHEDVGCIERKLEVGDATATPPSKRDEDAGCIERKLEAGDGSSTVGSSTAGSTSAILNSVSNQDFVPAEMAHDFGVSDGNLPTISDHSPDFVPCTLSVTSKKHSGFAVEKNESKSLHVEDELLQVSGDSERTTFQTASDQSVSILAPVSDVCIVDDKQDVRNTQVMECADTQTEVSPLYNQNNKTVSTNSQVICSGNETLFQSSCKDNHVLSNELEDKAVLNNKEVGICSRNEKLNISQSLSPVDCSHIPSSNLNNDVDNYKPRTEDIDNSLFSEDIKDYPVLVDAQMETESIVMDTPLCRRLLSSLESSRSSGQKRKRKQNDVLNDTDTSCTTITANESQTISEKSPTVTDDVLMVTPSHLINSSSARFNQIRSDPVPLLKDDSEVEILHIRRSKRRCFSLDGSPVKAPNVCRRSRKARNCLKKKEISLIELEDFQSKLTEHEEKRLENENDVLMASSEIHSISSDDEVENSLSKSEILGEIPETLSECRPDESHQNPRDTHSVYVNIPSVSCQLDTGDYICVAGKESFVDVQDQLTSKVTAQEITTEECPVQSNSKHILHKKHTLGSNVVDSGTRYLCSPKPVEKCKSNTLNHYACSPEPIVLDDCDENQDDYTVLDPGDPQCFNKTDVKDQECLNDDAGPDDKSILENCEDINEQQLSNSQKSFSEDIFDINDRVLQQSSEQFSPESVTKICLAKYSDLKPCDSSSDSERPAERLKPRRKRTIRGLTLGKNSANSLSTSSFTVRKNPPTDRRLASKPPTDRRLTSTPPTDRRLTSTPPTDRRLTSTPPTDRRLTSTPPTDCRLTSTPPTDCRLTSTPPTDRRLTSTPPTDRRLTSKTPTDRRLARTPPRDRRLARTPLTDRKLDSTPSTDRRLTSTPPTDRRLTGTPSTDRRLTSTPPTDRMLTSTPPTDRRLTSTPPTDRRLTSTPPTDRRLASTEPTDRRLTSKPPTHRVLASPSEMCPTLNFSPCSGQSGSSSGSSVLKPNTLAQDATGADSTNPNPVETMDKDEANAIMRSSQKRSQLCDDRQPSNKKLFLSVPKNKNTGKVSPRISRYALIEDGIEDLTSRSQLLTETIRHRPLEFISPKITNRTNLRSMTIDEKFSGMQDKQLTKCNSEKLESSTDSAKSSSKKLVSPVVNVTEGFDSTERNSKKPSSPPLNVVAPDTIKPNSEKLASPTVQMLQVAYSDSTKLNSQKLDTHMNVVATEYAKSNSVKPLYPVTDVVNSPNFTKHKKVESHAVEITTSDSSKHHSKKVELHAVEMEDSPNFSKHNKKIDSYAVETVDSSDSEEFVLKDEDRIDYDSDASVQHNPHRLADGEQFGVELSDPVTVHDLQCDDNRYRSLPQTSSPIEAENKCDYFKEQDSSEDESVDIPVRMKKKKRCAVIEDSEEEDSDMSQDSNTNHSQNLTSSSAFSSQSEVLTTQQKDLLETDCAKLKEQIFAAEAKIKDIATKTPGSQLKQKCSQENDKTPHRGQTLTDSPLHSLSVIPATGSVDGNNSSSSEESDDLFYSPLPPSPPPPTTTVPQGKPSPVVQEVVHILNKIRSPVLTKDVHGVLKSSHREDRAKPDKLNKVIKKPDVFEDVQRKPGNWEERGKSDKLNKVVKGKADVFEKDGQRKPGKGDEQGKSDKLNKVMKEKADVFEDCQKKPDLKGVDVQLNKNMSHMDSQQREATSTVISASGHSANLLGSECLLRNGESETTKLSGNTKLRCCSFVATGLSRNEVISVQRLAENNDCKFYGKFNSRVTHVIVKTVDEHHKMCDRTLKYFQGVAAKCFIVGFQWVVDCIEAGRLLPEEAYEISGDSVSDQIHFGPSRSRSTSSKLLSGFNLTCVGVSNEMTRADMIELLKLCGAEVAEDPWELGSGNSSGKKLIIRCLDMEDDPPSLSEVDFFNSHYKHLGVVTVSREWALDSISVYHVQPLADYLLTQVDNIQLPF